MTWTTIRTRTELALPHVTLTGTLAYNPGRAALIIADHDTCESEVLTVDLTVYGHLAAPGEVFVKDWSEHHGLAAALEAAGIATIVDTVTVGSFNATAYRMRLTEQEYTP